MTDNAQNFIAIAECGSGEIVIHAKASISNYDTLCGTSASDDIFIEIKLPLNGKINCHICKHIWEEARKFKKKDFEK